MSILACSTCSNYADTDDGEGLFDVPKINSEKKIEYICGACCEKYVNEDGVYDPELEEAA